MVIVKNTSVTSGGTTMLAGTCAADGSLENNSTVVGFGSANAIVRSPVALCPLLTTPGVMVRLFSALAEAAEGMAIMAASKVTTMKQCTAHEVLLDP